MKQFPHSVAKAVQELNVFVGEPAEVRQKRVLEGNQRLRAEHALCFLQRLQALRPCLAAPPPRSQLEMARCVLLTALRLPVPLFYV